MEFRLIAQHPAFLPITGAIAVVVALVVLVSAPTHTASSARPATVVTRAADPSSQAAEPAQLTAATIARVARGSLTVTLADQSLHLRLGPNTRVVVPYAGQMLLGAASDLRVGQHVRIAAVDRTPLRDGSMVDMVRVEPAARAEA